MLGRTCPVIRSTLIGGCSPLAPFQSLVLWGVVTAAGPGPLRFAPNPRCMAVQVNFLSGLNYRKQFECELRHEAILQSLKSAMSEIRSRILYASPLICFMYLKRTAMLVFFYGVAATERLWAPIYWIAFEMNLRTRLRKFLI